MHGKAKNPLVTGGKKLETSPRAQGVSRGGLGGDLNRSAFWGTLEL